MNAIQVQPSSEIDFSGSFSFDQFRKAMNGLDLVSSLMTMQKLGAQMGNQTAVSLNVELEFYNVTRVKKRAGILTKDFISFVSKEILMNSKRTSRKLTEIDLINLVYQYGNLETDLNAIRSEADKQKNGWLWTIRATNHQWHYLRLQSSIMARYYWIFSKVYALNPLLGQELDKVLGLNIFDAMKIGTCIFANFCPRDNGAFATSFLMSSYTDTNIMPLRPLLTERNIIKFFDVFAVDQKQYKKESKKFRLARKTLKKYEFNTLKRFPVVITDSDKDTEKYIIPSLADFLYGTFEGLYYVLLDKLDRVNKATLFQTIGNVFEKYIGELLQQYCIANLSQANIFPEIKYYIGSNEWKSADWLLVSADTIIQIECKKRKIDNYSKAGVQVENGAGIDKLLSDIAKELDKSSQKEQHIRDGMVTEVTYNGQRIINVVVFLDEMFAMNRFARPKIKEKMRCPSDNFCILGCWEFELVCQQSKNRNQRLVQSIQDVSDGKVEIYSIDFLDSIYHKFFNDQYNGR